MFSERIDFSHEPNLTIDELIRRVESAYPEVDAERLKKCYLFAEDKHSKQKRSSGEMYIIHPLNVAATLVKLKMDVDSIMSGFLHDVVEDCEVAPEEIEKLFGKSVAQIVVGCTKISKINFKSKEESQAENFRKMVVAMAQDLRVIIVKLADRMHNMRTLQYVSKEKQMAKAQETLDIYVPLASRLGINSVKGDLEDLCLRYLHPDTYYRLAEKISMKRKEREDYINDTIGTINERLMEYSVIAEVTGRPKHFYSIYKKMTQRGVDFDQIQDLLAFRVLTSNITECYKVLGVIHSAFTPVPGRFKDYIAIPKVNNYQSLHTTVIGPKAERIEIQIRTFEMHEVAERGVAAHWKYKERDKSQEGNKLKWVEELMEFNQNVTSSSEFMDVVKNDLDVGGIFIFTPAGDVKELRYGATALDFAYAVHTQVGNQCIGAKVNGKMVPLKYRLKSGDTVGIMTSKTQVPSKDWLKICKTSRAITKIKQYLQKVERDKHKLDGEELLERALKKYGTNTKTIEKNSGFHEVYDEMHMKGLEELQVQLGAGAYNLRDVLPKVVGIDYKEEPQEEVVKESFSEQIVNRARRSVGRDNAVIVDGLDDVQVRMGKCCNPIPGDPITGFITKGRGITVHAIGCHRAHEVENSRRIQVEWNKGYAFAHPVNIRVMTHDKPGILSKISKSINNAGINIRSAMARSLPDQKGSFVFEVEVKDYSELLKTISAIEQMEEVITVNRA